MKEHHINNWTCETSYHYDRANFRYPIYACQSTLTDPKMTFKGHPGFELEESGVRCKIIGPIQGQGKESGITDMMVIRHINGRYPMHYADPENISTLTNRWKKNDTVY